MINKMSTKTVLQVVIGTFGIAWISFGILIIANQFGYLEFSRESFVPMIFYTLGGLTPSIVVFVVLLKNKIMPVKELFKTIFAIKQPISMYLLVIGFFILYIGAGVLSGLYTPFSPVYLLTFPLMIIGGGLEEVGWRYVLQPSLERKFPFAVSSLFTGVIWAVWHLPLFFIKGTNQNVMMNFGLFILYVIGIAFLLAAVYRISKSVWLCILLHALINAPLEDPSCKMNIGYFAENIVPVAITTSVLIICSCAAVAIMKKHQKRIK